MKFSKPSHDWFVSFDVDSDIYDLNHLFLDEPSLVRVYGYYGYDQTLVGLDPDDPTALKFKGAFLHFNDQCSFYRVRNLFVSKPSLMVLDVMRPNHKVMDAFAQRRVIKLRRTENGCTVEETKKTPNALFNQRW